ncbi:MAG: hypothetical protein AB8B49_07345 [Nitratireductor sp.]
MEKTYSQLMGEVGAYLELKLETKDEAISVAELGLALVSVSDMYEDFAIKMGASESETKFEIQDLRKGSAILEMVGVGIGLMDQALIIKSFHGATKQQVKAWISGVPKDTAITDAKSQALKIEGMAKAVADSEDGKLSLAYKRETDSETEILMITKEDGQKMLENFTAVREQMKKVSPASLNYDEPQRVLMRLYQHNQDPDPSQKKRTAHKAIVRDIDSTPRPLGYIDQEIASELRELVSEVPYANTIFDVDVELVRENQALKSYRLVKLHGYFDDPDMPLLEA